MGYQRITDTVNIYHLAKTGSKEEYEAAAAITGLKVTIVPMGADVMAVFPGEATYNTFQCFVWDRVDIRIGDKVLSGSVVYKVKSPPQVYDAYGPYHQDVILERVVGT